MPERAEIEAVDALEALLGRIRWDLRDKGCEPQSATWSGTVAQAQAALDHARDARDHEAGIEAMGEVWVKLGNRDGLFGSVGLLDEASRRKLIERYLSARAGESNEGGNQ
jgi:hypothetical protein